MPVATKTFKKTARKEMVLLLLLVFAGLLLVPIAIFVVGSNIFGHYAGNGFGGFYSNIHGDLRDGKTVVVFLMFSPYIIWQLLRLTYHLFRRLGTGHSG